MLPVVAAPRLIVPAVTAPVVPAVRLPRAAELPPLTVTLLAVAVVPPLTLTEPPLTMTERAAVRSGDGRYYVRPGRRLADAAVPIGA